MQHRAGLGFFRWCFCLLLQLKIKVTIRNPIYPVLKWFCEWCTETDANNIQAEMYFETLKCMILETTGVQAQQAAYLQCASVAALSSHRLQWVLFCRGPACARWDWSLESPQRKNAHTSYLGIFSCHVNPMGTERWLEPHEIFTFLIMTNDKLTLFCGFFAITIY